MLESAIRPAGTFNEIRITIITEVAQAHVQQACYKHSSDSARRPRKKQKFYSENINTATDHHNILSAQLRNACLCPKNRNYGVKMLLYVAEQTQKSQFPPQHQPMRKHLQNNTSFCVKMLPVCHHDVSENLQPDAS